MRTIVCPVDFSENSYNAASYALQLANEFKSRIIMVHVHEIPLIFTDATLAMAREIESSMIADCEKRMESLKNDLVSKSKVSHIETQVLTGIPDQSICKTALKEDADLIIMGTTGKDRVERMLLGSTANKVISEAKCPVLLIPHGTKFTGIHKIVFATDLNENNLTAAKHIVPFAKHFDAEISFVFVDDKNLLHSDEYISNMPKKIRSHVNYNKISGYVSDNSSVTNGIEYFVKKHSADMLVMFKHTRGLLKSIINPSQTKKVSRIITVPLLSLTVESHMLAEA